MGALAQGLQSAGQAASDFGQARINFSDWQQQQRQQRLAEIIQGVRLQQIQQQMKLATQPQPYGIVAGPGGSQLGVEYDPNKPQGERFPTQQVTPPTFKPEDLRASVGKSAATAGLSEDEAKGVMAAFDMHAAEGDFKGGIAAATSTLEKFANSDRDPIKKVLAEGAALEEKGDSEGAQKKFDLAQKMAGAKRPTPNPTLFSLIQRAYRGDPEAKGELQQYQQMQNQLAMTRGQGYGAGRAMYQIQPYFDSTGNLVPLSNFDAIQMIHNGVPLTPGGHLSAKDAIAVQQFQSEMGSLMKGGPSVGGRPGIPALRDTLKAFDNPADRLIFAQVGGAAGHPTYGQENAWARNVLNQLLNSGLSNEGRQLVVSLARLNETVGRMRSVLGLPSTDNAMQMTLALVPGVQTPDSRMAAMYVDNLEAMGQQAVGIPVFQRGAAGPNVLATPQGSQSPAASGQPPPGAKVHDFTQIGIE